MKRCPKCGYREGFDWPSLLVGLAFLFLYAMFTVVVGDYIPKNYRWMVMLALLLFLAGEFWKSRREKKCHEEYLKLNPPSTERLKAHIKPSSSQ
jgi:hypothetical protein